MVIHDRTLEYYIEGMKNHLDLCAKSGNDPQKIILSNITYQMLTWRDKHDDLLKRWQAYFKQYGGTYEKALSNIDFRPTGDKKEGSIWYEVYSKSNPSSIPRSEVKGFKIRHKLYFTFIPSGSTAQEFMQSIIRFIQFLGPLHKNIHSLNVQENDDIRFKTESDLYSFLRHPDSLVIYFNQFKLKKQIQQIVNRVARENGVSFAKRYIRSDSGFDIKEIKAKQGYEEEKKSHSELIAEVIAGEIIKQKEYFQKASIQQWKEMLKKYLAEVNTWNEQQVLSTINKN